MLLRRQQRLRRRATRQSGACRGAVGARSGSLRSSRPTPDATCADGPCGDGGETGCGERCCGERCRGEWGEGHHRRPHAWTLASTAWTRIASSRGLNGLTMRSEEHTSELQSRVDLVCRLLLEKKKKNVKYASISYNKKSN